MKTGIVEATLKQRQGNVKATSGQLIAPVRLAESLVLSEEIPNAWAIDNVVTFSPKRLYEVILDRRFKQHLTSSFKYRIGNLFRSSSLVLRKSEKGVKHQTLLPC